MLSYLALDSHDILGQTSFHKHNFILLKLFGLNSQLLGECGLCIVDELLYITYILSDYFYILLGVGLESGPLRFPAVCRYINILGFCKVNSALDEASVTFHGHHLVGVGNELKFNLSGYFNEFILREFED